MLGRICHLSWMKVAIDQCFVPGSSITFRSRATPFGQSSRNARERVRDPGQRCRLRGRSGPGRVEDEAAARAAGVLRLQQDVLVRAPLAAGFERVRPLHLRQRGREVPRLLGAVPRQARREPEQRIRVAADFEPGEAAGVLVEVRTRNADVGARIEAVALRHRDVVVVVQAAADVEQQGVGQRPRPGRRRADALVRTGAGEAVVGRPAVLAERTRIEDDRPHEAHAVGQLVFRAHAVIQLGVEAVGGLLARLRLLEVRLAERRAGDVRFGNELQQPPRDWVDAILRDHVVGKRRPVVAVGGIARERIVDALRHRAEVAVAHRHRRHRGAHDVAGVVDRPLIVAEEEQLVAHDRAAEGEAAVEKLRRRLQVGEVVARVGRVGVAEDEDASLELVRAGLERHVRDGAAGAAELRVVVARRHADRLQRVGRRDDHLQQPGLVVVVQPLDERIVRLARLPVDLHGERVLRVEERRVLAVRPRGARHRDQEALEVPVEGERHVAHHLRFEDAPGVGAVGLQDGGRADDGDRFFEGAELQPQVDADRRVDRHDDAVAQHLLEAGQRRDDPVRSVLQARERVQAGFVGHHVEADVRARLGDGDGRAGHRQPRLIGDVPE